MSKEDALPANSTADELRPHRLFQPETMVMPIDVARTICRQNDNHARVAACDRALARGCTTAYVTAKGLEFE